MAFKRVDVTSEVLIDELGRLRTPRLRKIKPEKDDDGFLTFKLPAHPEPEVRYVHIEVARHFGKIPAGVRASSVSPEDVGFADDDKENCKVSNLVVDDKFVPKDKAPAEVEAEEPEASADDGGTGGTDGTGVGSEVEAAPEVDSVPEVEEEVKAEAEVEAAVPNKAEEEELPISQDLTAIKGVGKATAEKLDAAGVRAIVEVATMEVERLAELTGLSIPKAKAVIENAQIT